jgi:hypothetical protein
MRYWEIIETENDPASQIANQQARITSAFGALQSKQAGTADSRASAQKLPLGPERTRRLQAASRREADARRAYNDTRMAAEEKARDLMSKE